MKDAIRGKKKETSKDGENSSSQSSHSTEKKIGSYDDVLLRKKMDVGKT